MDIFDSELEQSRQLLKKYKRHINTTRALAFVVLGLLAIVYGIGWAVAKNEGLQGVLYEYRPQFVVVLLLLAVVGCSYIKPFIPFLFLTSLFCLAGIISVIFIMLEIITNVYDSVSGNFTETVYALLVLVILINVTFFMVRGTVSAYKYGKLRKLVEG